MSRVRVALFVALAASLGGCPQSPPATDSQSVSRVAPGIQSGSNKGGNVRVRLNNKSGFGVESRVTMRLAGERVRFAFRVLAIGEMAEFVGPDRAETVAVETTILTPTPQTQAIRNFRLGYEFESGQTIEVNVLPPDNQNGQDNHNSNDNNSNSNGNNGNDNSAPRTLIAEILGLDSDVRANPGADVLFNVRLRGPVASALVNAFADPDDDPTNGNEIPIENGRSGAELLGFTWVVPNLTPGLYSIYAEASGAGQTVRVKAAGRVRLNAQPQIAVDSPRDATLVTIGRPLIVSWIGQDADDDAQITVYLDVDETVNGNERILRSGISEDDINDRQLELSTDELQEQDYFVGAFIDDGLTRNYATPIRLCLTTRLAGRYEIGELPTGRLTKIVGTSGSHALGSALDVSRDVNGDGLADLLLADPDEEVAALDGVRSGAVHYRAKPHWPAVLTLDDDFDLQFVGSEPFERVGEAVALMGPIDGDADGDFLIGAPGHAFGKGTTGRVSIVNGIAALSRTRPIFLDRISSPLGTHIDGETSDIGRDVAFIGDADGDGANDYAFGGLTDPLNGFESAVWVLAGGYLPPEGFTNDIGSDALITGVKFRAPASALAGTSIRGVRDVNGDEFAEIAIGAPGAGVGEGPATGIVYLIYGDAALFARYPNGANLVDVGGSVPGVKFTGENSGDSVGYSLATGDFNGDGRLDLAIGAPGYDHERGRVYIIYNIGQEFPASVFLGDVGVSVPGVVIDGVARGDQLGLSLANAHHFDVDGTEDLIIGAPGAESGRGNVALIYGGSLPTAFNLSLLGTCDIQGFYVVGEGAGDALGSAVSGGGSVRGDSGGDIGIGAPHTTDGGRAYVIFGEFD